MGLDRGRGPRWGRRSGDRPAPHGSGDPDDEPDTARSGRDLPIAVGVGVLLGALLLLSVYTVKQAFLALAAVALGIALTELTRAFGTRGIRVPVPPVAFGGLAMLVAAYVTGVEGLVAVLALTMVAVMVWRLADGAHGYVSDMGAGVFAVTYVPFLACFTVLMLTPTDGAERIVIFVAVTICSDIGGYFAGTFLGRHPLAPAISPKKTWEGMAGSAVACVACGAVLLPVLLHGAVWQGALLGVGVVAAATLGDLIESMVKRDLGVKDMGTLLPEHGGVLDRLDSLLVAAPVAWLLMEVFVPPLAG